MDNHSQKSIRAYDRKADSYDNTFDGKFTEKFKNFLLQTLAAEDGDCVLDVGCGNGTLLSRIAKLKSIQGFGTDISPQMIKNAAAHYPEFKFAVSGCESIPFDDSSMDVITTCAAYHHFPDVGAFANEVKRLLKQDGNLYIAEIYLPPAIRQFCNIFLPLSKDGDVKFYSSKEIGQTFSQVGFAPVKTVTRGHIQIVHLKPVLVASP